MNEQCLSVVYFSNFKFEFTLFSKSMPNFYMTQRYVNSQNAAISLKPIHFIDKPKLILYPSPEFFITGIAIVNTTTNNHNRAVVPASKALVSPNNHVMTNNQQNYPQLDYSQQQQQALPPPASHHLVRYSFSSVCFKVHMF